MIESKMQAAKDRSFPSPASGEGEALLASPAI
jgi:hypothetical protein